MADLFGDSFDLYTVGSSTEMVQYGQWTSGNPIIEGSITRFAYGKSARFGTSNISMTKSGLPTTANTLFTCFAFRYNLILGGSATIYRGMVQFQQGGTAQVSVLFRDDGAIEVRRGTNTGTLLATFPAAWAGNIWDHWQIRVVFNGATGSVTLRKNGDTTDTFTVTGVNTMMTANAYADGILYHGQTSSNAVCVDDVMIWDNTGSAAPTDWVGDIRAYDLSPSANTIQKDFLSPSIVTQVPALANLGTTNQAAVPADVARLNAFSANENGTITRTTARIGVNLAGHMRMALYAADNPSVSGKAGTLLGVSDEVTNPLAGDVAFNWSSPPNVTAGTTYWVAVMADASWTPQAGVGVGGERATLNYATGFTNNPTQTTGGQSPGEVVTITLANFEAVNDLAHDGDTTYVASSTVGALDLYELDDLPSTPQAIYAVRVRMISRKSDAAARSGQLAVKSGATTDLSAAVVQSTSYTAINKTYATDPNTGAPWTAAAVNALQIGPKVSA